MSNERFDKLFRKNLESIKPDYQPRALDRIRSSLPATSSWQQFIQHGGWVVSGLLLVGWLTTFYVLFENQRVMKHLSSKMAMLNKPVTPVSNAPSKPSTNRIDTVYIVKRTVMEHRHYYQSEQGQWTTEPLKTGGEAAQPAMEGNASRRTGESTSQDAGRFASNRHRSANPRSNEKTVLSARSAKKSTENNFPTRDRAAGQSPVFSSGMPQNHPMSNPPERMSTDSVYVAKITPDSIAVTPEKLSASIPPVAAIASPRVRQPFRFSALKPRVGIESMGLLSGSIGAGPAFEFFPEENLGLSIGLQASQLNSENLHALQDFNAATGQEFIELYRPYLPAQFDRIADISIRTSVISLPVSLKYYLPWKPSFSLFFQAGTSFDVSAFQQVDFESYLNAEERRHSFETDAKARVFHNFMFGAGVQYRRPRLSAQLSPYYLYDFRSIINTPKGSNLGFRASVWIDLFK
ncbi:porin family protein [Larkinella sp. C7]|uniref:porin family protein n=1 Tax=Larkinella sp. C7 TaxID=2576607 RepID=UPI0011110A7B|nr:porin family protein [Larkinella sp. C7]